MRRVNERAWAAVTDDRQAMRPERVVIGARDSFATALPTRLAGILDTLARRAAASFRTE